jgi:hypothetical protein
VGLLPERKTFNEGLFFFFSVIAEVVLGENSRLSRTGSQAIIHELALPES